MKRSESSAKEFVCYALHVGALELIPGGRKLKSGRISPYFFNAGLFDTGEAMGELADGYADAIGDCFADSGNGSALAFDVIYGPPYKGPILVPVVATLLSVSFGSVRFCTSRKEAKMHGDGGVLIGSPIKPGDKVLIVDDVITDGGTKREAVEFVRSFGGIPVGLAIAFDRQERGVDNDLSATQEFELEYGIPVHSIAGLSDLIDALKEMPEKTSDSNNSGILEKILAYQKEYGVTTV